MGGKLARVPVNFACESHGGFPCNVNRDNNGDTVSGDSGLCMDRTGT